VKSIAKDVFSEAPIRATFIPDARSYMFSICSLDQRMTMPVAIGADADAAEVEATFRVLPNLYLVGSLERGVTIYKQQVRAHNLAWALWERERKGERTVRNVAVVGGGIAGLTLAACLLSLFEGKTRVTLFEQSWDLCPFQQGADVRWVHPRIYEWPAEGSRAPSASLPVLDWSEGRASDVARTILREFGAFANAFGNPEQALTVCLALRNFEIDARALVISWVGHRALHRGEFVRVEKPEGGASKFDTIVVAAGFGAETIVSGTGTQSYWRNEQLSQPALDHARGRYLISGFGDGALVDLCRLTIERFRQDTILYEIFGADLARTEALLADELARFGVDNNLLDLFLRIEESLLSDAKDRLASRIRKDTQVILHLRGRRSQVKDLRYIFDRYSSFQHRLITYMLYRCGAFALDFSEMADAIRRHRIDPAHVLCRYGADTMAHLGNLFTDRTQVEPRFAEMKEVQLQATRRLWTPGTFRHYSNR
jgi:hypothetical protein